MARKRDWKKYERNWRAYERFRKDEVELFLRKARAVVWSLDPPWVAKLNGRPAYDARGLVLCALLKVKMDYRSISSYLKANPDLLKIIGLDRAPSRETIRTALLKPPESYLKRLNDLLVEPFKKGGLAADSTGFSTKRYETWFTIRKGKGRRRAYTKLHTIIDLESLAILNIKVTKGTKHDSPTLQDLIKHIPEGTGEFVADSAHLSRRNLELIAKKGRAPYIKPKKNTRLKAKGSQTWRSMVKLYKESREEFEKHYHKRSRVESVYSVLKRVFGNALSSRRRRSQRNELYLRVINYNIGINNLTTIKEKVN